jgi:putative transposase
MSYRRLFYHIVFRPKNSARVINADKETLLYKYIWGFAQDKGAVLYRIGGMPDHIHMLVDIPPSISIAGFMRDLKTSSAVFMRNHHDDFPLFEGWAKSYCVLSYSFSEKENVINYIKGQKEHHKTVSFRDEYLKLLQEWGIDVDMKYFLKD